MCLGGGHLQYGGPKLLVFALFHPSDLDGLFGDLFLHLGGDFLHRFGLCLHFLLFQVLSRPYPSTVRLLGEQHFLREVAF